MVSARFEQQNGNLAQVEIDEVLGLVGHVAPEVSSHNAVPGGVVFFVKLLEWQIREFIMSADLIYFGNK